MHNEVLTGLLLLNSKFAKKQYRTQNQLVLSNCDTIGVNGIRFSKCFLKRNDRDSFKKMIGFSLVLTNNISPHKLH